MLQNPPVDKTQIQFKLKLWLVLKINKTQMRITFKMWQNSKLGQVFNRSGIAGADLQTPLSLIHLFISWFIQWSYSSRSLKYHISQTIRANELKIWKNVHPPQHVTCQLSCVTCQVAHVTCHMSHFKCHISFFSYF